MIEVTKNVSKPFTENAFFQLHFAQTDNPYLIISIILHFLFFLILLFVSELSELILKLELVNGIL